MREYLKKEQFSKPIFIMLLSLWILIFFMIGMITVLNLRLYTTIVNGHSMEHTLSDGTEVLLINADVLEIKRGDIVSVNAEDLILGNFHYLKRVIGLPNEKVTIQGNTVYINEQLLEEPYAFYEEKLSNEYSFVLGNDEYFIMGDNRCNSEDSRHIGPINKETILSVVLTYK